MSRNAVKQSSCACRSQAKVINYVQEFVVLLICQCEMAVWPTYYKVTTTCKMHHSAVKAEIAHDATLDKTANLEAGLSSDDRGSLATGLLHQV